VVPSRNRHSFARCTCSRPSRNSSRHAVRHARTLRRGRQPRRDDRVAALRPDAIADRSTRVGHCIPAPASTVRGSASRGRRSRADHTIGRATCRGGTHALEAPSRAVGVCAVGYSSACAGIVAGQLRPREAGRRRAACHPSRRQHPLTCRCCRPSRITGQSARVAAHGSRFASTSTAAVNWQTAAITTIGSVAAGTSGWSGAAAHWMTAGRMRDR
jgi:hypothetical protein